MINVYGKNTTVFNNNGLATLIPTSCEFSPSINGGWTFKMEHPFDIENRRHNYLVKNNILRVTGIDCIREWDNPEQMFRIYDTKKNLDSITVIAFPLGMEAQYDAMIEDLEIRNKTGIQAAAEINAYVENHDSNTKYEISSNIAKIASSKWENTNLIGAISGSADESFVNNWGGEVIYDNYKIKIRDICGDQNHARSYPIRYGRNLIGLTHEEDMSSVITRLYPISSDDVRLNTWTDVTDQGGNTYVDSNTGRSSEYPFIRAQFVDVKYSLIDTDEKSISQTHAKTVEWEEGIVNTTTAIATTLWDSIKNDLTNTYSAAYIKQLLSGEDGITKYLQNRVVFAHKNWQSFTKSCLKQGVEWIKSDELPNWEWHEDTSVTPHAWWYGDNSVDPAVSYAKNCYVKIGKYWEYFNDDGYWLDYKRLPDEDMEWHEAKDNSGRKWFGYKKGYYAHNEYVYVTVDGQMKEWFYDSDGWYDEDSSGDSDKSWHGDASSGYWFGEEGATSEEKSKYIHDRWAWIDGTYYWFDQYGYTDADPAHSMPDYPWGDQTSEEGKSWFGNPDDELGAVYLSNQWAKISNAPNNIESDYCYFDNDGWLIDMAQKESDTIAWFANTIYNGVIDYVKTQLTAAYTLLFSLMTSWCNDQFANGLDAPTVNVTVDLIDLSNTNEYSEYAKLERIALGDSVLVIGKDGSQYEERVVGLTYDCIRGYNTKVEVGALSKSVGQVLSSSFKGNTEEQKLIAGDNVIIDGKVISVGDYVSRVVGITDVLLNNSSITNGNLASFGIQAGENISISRDGNVLTINSTAEGGNEVYVGTDTPSDSIGNEHDLYLQYNNPDNVFSELIPDQNITVQSYERLSFNSMSLELGGIMSSAQPWELQDSLHIPLVGLIEGQTYRVTTVTTLTDGIVHRYSQGDLANNCWAFMSDTEHYAVIIFDDELNVEQNKSGTFVAGTNNELVFRFWAMLDGHNASAVVDSVTIEGVFDKNVTEIYGKIDGHWEKYEGGETYEAGDYITIEDNVISGNYQPFEGTDGETDGESGLVPQPLITDTNKYLRSDGTWAEVQGGGGTSLILDAVKYSTEEQVVGIWTDGKPLYQKTFDCGALLNAQTKEISFTEDMETATIIDAFAMSTSEGYVISLPDIVPNYVAGSVRIYVSKTAKKIYIYSQADMRTYDKSYVTIQYTKTTDAVGSGGYQAYGFSPIIFSTVEREVGVWKDNKPLYQKTIFKENVNYSANSNYVLGTLDTDVEQVCKIDGLFRNSIKTTMYQCPYSTANTYARLQYTIASKEVIFNANESWSSADIYATVYYTKTTDVAGSGEYNTLGIPNVHYDGNEKVIGTYFGETLYEKTIHVTEASEVETNQYTTEIQSLNVDKVFLVNGRVKLGSVAGGIWINSPYYNSVNYNTSIGVTNTEITVVATRWKYTEAELTIQYTKTS